MTTGSTLIIVTVIGMMKIYKYLFNLTFDQRGCKDKINTQAE